MFVERYVAPVQTLRIDGYLAEPDRAPMRSHVAVAGGRRLPDLAPVGQDSTETIGGEVDDAHVRDLAVPNLHFGLDRTERGAFVDLVVCDENGEHVLDEQPLTIAV
jgi:hypothetical protein